ncbi:AAA domain-containing protein [Neobacillus terrae]|uniref:AAA domain-containing protein n=1 Tax=Neobacillus terrae TaxID=3034837 RepID=UPI0014082BEE|nr:AAA domain-containing protein [Neobacillus terrae]NHM32548.1 AAA family ATPase [Neobacillus terrae]
MNTTIHYIKEWQQALINEIMHLKKYGSSKYLIRNGRLLSGNNSFIYYFDSPLPIKVPVGSVIRIEWGNIKEKGRLLSSEGKGVMVELEKPFGDLLKEAYLLHDPWELLDQLIERLDDIKKDKKKRLRIKRLMDPSMPSSHPAEKIKSNVQELYLRSKYNPVTYVWGPPGTGKTYTLARTAANYYFQKKKVLILSHSNQAVDVILAEISQFIKKKGRFQEGDVLRYGQNAGLLLKDHEGITTSQLLKNQDSGLLEKKEKLIDERQNLKQDLWRSFSHRDSNKLIELETKIARVMERIRQKEIHLIKEAYIIGTTLAKAASDLSIYEREFDIVIVDEASMAYVPQVGFAAALGKRVVICGDFKQLPPIAQSRDSLVSKWLKEDIFHRAGVVDSVQTRQLHPHLFLLKEQRRMHPEISAFTNRFVYNSLVGDHAEVLKNRLEIAEKAPFPGRASILLDTSFSGPYCINERTSKSRMNLWHLLLSFQLIHEAYKEGANSIGYVTPYRAQANMMELLLDDLYEKERINADIISATVHRFQGSERDVMIFDTTDSDPQERAGMLLTGNESERLINVAITRTKGKFVHVSSQNFIRKRVFQGKTLRQLLDHQVKAGQTVTTREIGVWIKNQHPRLQWMHALKLDRIFQDISQATSSIILCLPNGAALSQKWVEALENRKKKAKLIIISDSTEERLEPDFKEEEPFSFPFVMIDGQILWLGMPLEGLKDARPPFVTARLESEKICSHLLDQMKERVRGF